MTVSGLSGGHAARETIAAISTAPGEGAIALARVSGAEALAVVEPLFAGRCSLSTMEPRRQYFGALQEDGRTVDEVLLTVHRAPRSYTGEDVVEIACHGGVLVTRRVLELLLRHGARPAAPGEFTQRAFLNGKLDLTQAEAVMDVISAQTDLALSAAQEQLEGQLGRRFAELRGHYLELLAHLEAYIDFPEEDIAPETGAALSARIERLLAEVEALLVTADRGRVLREGVRTVIFGAPNVGKSSLLNLLLGYERAIVSATAGTTRDSLEEAVNVCGVPLRLIDTAGIRRPTDDVESAGIDRTFRQLERAELVLHVQDATAPPAGEKAPHPARELLVLNKIDLGEHPAWSGCEAVRISCRTECGLTELERAIEKRLLGESSVSGARLGGAAINARHRAGLELARDFTQRAQTGLRQQTPPEFVAEDLRAAIDALGGLVGPMESDEVLGQIFATFCIGK